MNEALRDWVTNVRDTYYIIGSRRRPASVSDDGARFPGGDRHARRARRCSSATGGCPTRCVACVGGGSNAMGLFAPFVGDASVQLHGVEAAGEGIATGRHAATLSRGPHRRLHGSKSLRAHDDDGQILPAHSISAGLDYPGVGPEHAWLKESGARDLRVGHRRRGAGGARSCSRAPRASCARSRPRTRSPICRGCAPTLRRRRRSSWSRSRAAATRTCRRWPQRSESTRERADRIGSSRA